MNKKMVIAILLTFCLTTLLMIPLTRSTGTYDPWADVSGPTPGVPDGVINMRDVAYEIALFNTKGTPINRSAVMSLEYDTGWIDITDKCGQYFNITHNLNSTDLMLDIQGKTTLDGGIHQRNLGLTEYTKGWTNVLGNGLVRSLVPANDSGYMLAGEIFDSQDFEKVLLIKVDSIGNVQWNKTLGTPFHNSFAYSIVRTLDNGYAIAGGDDFAGAPFDFWLVKTDAYGNMQWNMSYGGANLDYARVVLQTKDKGYVLAGQSSSFGANICWYLIKTDENGTLQWSRSYYGATGHDDYVYDVIQTTDGGYALTGSAWVGSNFYETLLKIDANGNQQWSQTYNPGNLLALVQTNDGGYALAADYYLIKTDAQGIPQWQSYMLGGYASAIAQTADNGYVLAGAVVNPQESPWIAKTDPSGNIQFEKVYNEFAATFYSLVQTLDGGYVMTGSTFSSVPNVLLVKTDVELGLAWTDSTANTVTLYRGATDPYWNFVRVRIWKPESNP